MASAHEGSRPILFDADASVPDVGVRATPTGQVRPLGPWLQYPLGFF